MLFFLTTHPASKHLVPLRIGAKSLLHPALTCDGEGSVVVARRLPQRRLLPFVHSLAAQSFRYS